MARRIYLATLMAAFIGGGTYLIVHANDCDEHRTATMPRRL